MKWFLGVLFLVLDCVAFASRICVRNVAASGFDICSVGVTTRHAYVLSVDPKQKPPICVMTYDDARCKFDKQEFAHAIKPSGEIVCVLNHNQPGSVGNYCGNEPKNYAYVLDPWDH